MSADMSIGSSENVILPDWRATLLSTNAKQNGVPLSTSLGVLRPASINLEITVRFYPGQLVAAVSSPT